MEELTNCRKATQLLAVVLDFIHKAGEALVNVDGKGFNSFSGQVKEKTYMCQPEAQIH